MAIEKIDEHGEAEVLWLLHKVPSSEQLWFQGQLKIVNDGQKIYMVIFYHLLKQEN